MVVSKFINLILERSDLKIDTYFKQLITENEDINACFKNEILHLNICLFATVFAVTLFGPWTPLPVDDPTVIKLADQAVVDINAQDNSLYYNKLILIRDKRRVGDKIEYELKLVIRQTDCPKSKPYTDTCQINQDTLPQICTYELFSRAGSKNKITTLQCDELKSYMIWKKRNLRFKISRFQKKIRERFA
uniref:Cystatin domain-containing protein n=1 Tax=Tetranychus urticae TaxID=32264 RepID=T1JW16_TETUR